MPHHGDREDQDLDEDPFKGVMDERPGLAHSDVKLACKAGESLCYYWFEIYWYEFLKLLTMQKMLYVLPSSLEFQFYQGS